MIDTNGKLPPPQAPRLAGLEKCRIIEETMDQLLAWHVIEQSKSGTVAVVIPV